MSKIKELIVLQQKVNQKQERVHQLQLKQAKLLAERNAIKMCIAYSLAKHGDFDTSEFVKFIRTSEFRNEFHGYWNHVSMTLGGYNRIN